MMHNKTGVVKYGFLITVMMILVSLAGLLISRRKKV